MKNKRILIVGITLFCATVSGVLSTSLINSKTIAGDQDKGFTKLFSDVKINNLPGIYDHAVKIELSAPEGGQLYYKTDFYSGFKKYKDPFTLDVLSTNDKSYFPMTTSVDPVNTAAGSSRCYSNDYINNIYNTGKYVLHDLQPILGVKYVSPNGAIYTHYCTYFIESDIDFSKLPLISLTMSYEDWFTGNDSIYNNIHLENEKRANLEYFDPTYNETFALNTKIKLGGNWSKGYPQRTLNTNFNKDENGAKNKKVTAHVFKEATTCGDPNKRITNLSRFRIHNSGNCFEEETGVNDTVLHNLMRNTNIGMTETRPCLVYLNGEYWGLYYIREHYADVFFETNYGVDKDNVILYEYKGNWLFDDGADEQLGAKYLKEMNDYLNSKDFTKDSVVDTFESLYVDLDSLIDIMVAESFAGNWDFVGNYNNLKMWRTISEEKGNDYADTRWRFCLHDADFAFNNDWRNFLDPSCDYSYNNFLMMKKLLKNRTFRNRFYARAAELLETNLSELNCATELDRCISEIEPFKLDSQMRWGKTKSFYKAWMNNVNSCFDFFKRKCSTYLNDVKAALGKY